MAFAFDNTLGAVLIGFAVACVVYGILLTQTFSYFSLYPSDRPVYKILVRHCGSDRRPFLADYIALPLRWCSFCKSFSFRHKEARLLNCVARLLETADQVFIGHAVYYYSVTSFANPIALSRGSVTWCVTQHTRHILIGI